MVTVEQGRSAETGGNVVAMSLIKCLVLVVFVVILLLSKGLSFSNSVKFLDFRLRDKEHRKRSKNFVKVFDLSKTSQLAPCSILPFMNTLSLQQLLLVRNTYFLQHA